MNKRYINQIVGKLKCSGKRRKEIKKQLISDFTAEIEKGENVQDELETLAEAAMSLPEILIDEINELANQFLDDIVIDTMGDVPCILEQYITQLTQIGGF